MKSFITLLFFCLINGLLSSCNRHEPPQFNGYVEADNIYLASPFYGVLQQLAVVRGQAVKKGQLLVHLNPDPQALNTIQSAAELKQAQSMLADMMKPKRPPEIDAIKAQIAQTESRIKLAGLRADRYNKLFRRNATDKDSMDAADTNLQQEEDAKAQYEANLMLAQLGSREDQIAAQGAQVDALKAKLNITRWELAQKTLVAPTDGVIFDTYYRQGEYVAAQQAVLSLLAPENMYIEFFVPLKFLAQIKSGQKIYFTCEGCAPNNQAEINYISPTAEYLPPLVYSRDNASKLVFRIKARMQQPQQFKTGQPVTVTL